MSCACKSYTQDFAYDSWYEGKRMNFIYCPGCGDKIREKCSDCGRMERMGRAVCESRIAQIRLDFEAIPKKAISRNYLINDWGGISFFIGALVLIGMNREAIEPLAMQLGAFGSIALVGFLIMTPMFVASHFFAKYCDRKLKKSEADYWQQNPGAKADWDKVHA